MWGQAGTKPELSDLPRIIPTRVGTRSALLSSTRYVRDHPHACGDKSAQVLQYFTGKGSSPRVWGQGIKFTILFIKMRIIPTRVGTRYNLSEQAKSSGDHPHACGDKLRSECLLLIRLGSSPRVWGQVNMWFLWLTVTGIIPTRVGTSQNDYYRRDLLWDHPHACGDKKPCIF